MSNFGRDDVYLLFSRRIFGSDGTSRSSVSCVTLLFMTSIFLSFHRDYKSTLCVFQSRQLTCRCVENTSVTFICQAMCLLRLSCAARAGVLQGLVQGRSYVVVSWRRVAVWEKAWHFHTAASQVKYRLTDVQSHLYLFDLLKNHINMHM